jgi:hypothetical protein
LLASATKDTIANLVPLSRPNNRPEPKLFASPASKQPGPA